MPLTWTPETSPLDSGQGQRVAFAPELGANGLLCAVGSGGSAIVTSDDGGSTWTARASDLDGGQGYDVIWVASLTLFIAGGYDGTDGAILTSPDGIIWTNQGNPFESGYAAAGIAWSETQALLVAVGGSSGTGPAIVTSADGSIWTPSASPFDSVPCNLNGVCWAGDALGLWVVANVGAAFGGVIEGIATSPDTSTWTPVTSAFDSGDCRLVFPAPNSGLLFAVGQDAGATITTLSSPDGAIWATVPTPLDGDSAYGYGGIEVGTKVVIVGYSGSAGVAIIESANAGATWTSDISPFDTFGSGSGAFGVCAAASIGLLVAVGIPGDGAVAIATAVLSQIPPDPDTQRVFADLPVRTFVTDKDSRTLSILDRRATDRQFLFTLNQPAYHTFQVASDDVEINRPFPDADSPANLTNNRRLLFALQRIQGADPPYQPLFGGIIMTPEDQGADTPTTRATVYDAWQYMMSRPVRDPETGDLPGPNGLTFASGSLASDIALGLLQITEIEDGETHIEWYSGDIEPSDPLPSTITFDAGLSVGEAWQQLCNTGTIDIHLDPIYEPIDLPGKINRLRIVAQSAGTAAGPILYNDIMGWDKGGRSLMGVNRLVDGTRLANKIAYFAGQGGAAVPVQTDATSVAAFGVYFAQQFFPGSNDITTIALLAVTELAIRRNGARSISLDPAPERVGLPRPHELLGSYVPVWASRNLREPLGIDYDAFDADNPGASGYQRIYAVPVAVDNNGVTRLTGVLTSKES